MAKQSRNGNSDIARKIPKTVTRHLHDNANVISQPQKLQRATLVVDFRHEIEKIMEREKRRGMIFFYVFTQNGLWVQADEKEPQQRLKTLGEFISFLDKNRLDYH